ncbi:MAG: hypothetical protein LBN00_06955 [Oscillospiraceae bacterium]|nr:hypothetical protein [Oscillospiraceae bacterium]
MTEPQETETPTATPAVEEPTPAEEFPREAPLYIPPMFSSISEFDMKYDILVSGEIQNADIRYGMDYALITTATATYTDAQKAYIDMQNRRLGTRYTYDTDMFDRSDRNENIFLMTRDGKRFLTTVDSYSQSGGSLILYDGNIRTVLEETNAYSVTDYFTPELSYRVVRNWGENDYLIELETNEKIELGDNWRVTFNADASVYSVSSYSENAQSILIYAVGREEPIFEFDVYQYLVDPTLSCYISQIAGDSESGFVLFNNTVRAYKLSYPSGKVEVLGDYMFEPQFSPDGNYLAYTSLHDFNWNNRVVLLGVGGKPKNSMYAQLWINMEMLDRGWYIKEITTGKTAFFDPDGGPLPENYSSMYGDLMIRSWLERDTD